MVKIAIVGAGFIGKVHSDSYKNILSANVVAVIDKEESKGLVLAKDNNANYYSNIDECFRNEEIDNVDICLPTFLHANLVKKAANAGKNVFCEKPIALSLEEADQMIQIVEKNKVKGMVGHVIRFWPEYVKIKELIEKEQFGKPIFAHCERLSVLPDWHQNNWGLKEKYSGGAAIDLHIHDLDYLEWIFGRPTQVCAQGVFNPKNLNEGGLAHIVTNLEFSNGIMAVAEGGWVFKGAFPFTMVLRILCEDGTIEWIFRAGKNIEKRDNSSKIKIYRNDNTIEILNVDKTDPFLLECKYFIDCVHNNKKIEKATFKDGKSALELALAAVNSAKNKKMVNF